MPPITNHPLHYTITNKLHTQPFPAINAPSRAAYLAIKPASNATGHNHAANRTHLINLLNQFNTQHPQPNTTHYFNTISKHQLKQKSHTEFMTYTIFNNKITVHPFDTTTFDIFPNDQLSKTPNTRITSTLIQIEVIENNNNIIEKTKN